MGPSRLVLAAAVLWGTTGTVQALGLAGISPARVAALRIVIGAAGLLALALIGPGLRRSWPPVATLVAAGSVAVNQTLFFASVRLTGVAVGTVVTIGTSPVLAGLLAYRWRGERPGRRWALATILAMAGSVLLLGPWRGRTEAAGVLLALGAGAAYAVYTVAAKGLVEEAGASAAMAMVFGGAALLLLPLLAAGAMEPLREGASLATALYLGLVTVTAAYLLFARGLEHVPVASAATLTLAEPLTAGLLGVLVLGERLSTPATLGVLVMLAGLALLTRGGDQGGDQAGDPDGDGFLRGRRRP